MPFTMPEGFADGDYPTSWTGFIGQQRAKDQIRLAAQSAKARKQPMDHILIASGTPGIGKTSLGLLAARTMGRKVLVVTGPVPATRAYGLLAKLSDRDVLFIDEAHKLVEGGKKHAEWLLHYLQDGILLGALKRYRYSGASGWTAEEIGTPRVTVIAATTEPGRLPTTLTGRFPIRPALTDYTPDEGAKIAAQLARKVMAGLPLGGASSLVTAACSASSRPIDTLPGLAGAVTAGDSPAAAARASSSRAAFAVSTYAAGSNASVCCSSSRRPRSSSASPIRTSGSAGAARSCCGHASAVSVTTSPSSPSRHMPARVLGAYTVHSDLSGFAAMSIRSSA